MHQHITLADYWMGRDVLYRHELTEEVRGHALETVARANLLLDAAVARGIALQRNPAGSLVRSGWRPSAVNAAVPGAAPRSRHMTGQAIDIEDPEGELDEWLISAAGQALAAEVGLWYEHPSQTKSWCHVQTTPQASYARTGLRYFYA